jgi:hypothetical protein
MSESHAVLTGEEKLTTKQGMLLYDLAHGPVWMLYKGEARSMNKLIDLGLAQKVDGEWKITKAGSRRVKSIYKEVGQ